MQDKESKELGNHEDGYLVGLQSLIELWEQLDAVHRAKRSSSADSTTVAWRAFAFARAHGRAGRRLARGGPRAGPAPADSQQRQLAPAADRVLRQRT